MLEYRNAIGRCIAEENSDQYILNITRGEKYGDVTGVFLVLPDEAGHIEFGANLGSTMINNRYRAEVRGAEKIEQVQKYLRSKNCVWENKPEE